MDIVVINLSSERIESDTLKIFHSEEQKIERKLADMSIQLDEHIFLNDNNVDCVFVTDCKLSSMKGIDILDSDTVYFSSGLKLSFYCNPGIFSNIGKIYKINFNKIINELKEDEQSKFFLSKLYFLINRLGYKINVKDT